MMRVNKLDKFAGKKVIWLVILYLSFCSAIQTDYDPPDEHQAEKQTQSENISRNLVRAHYDLKKNVYLNDSSPGRARGKRQDLTSNRCNVPTGSEITYVIVDENTKKPINLPRGSKAPRYSRLEITCKNGYALLAGGKTYQRSFCHAEEGWVPALSPCIKTCPTLKPVNVDLSCFYGNSRERIACNQNMVSDIRVEPKCKPFHIADKKVDYREMKCQKNGEWDQDLYKCVPECGTINELDTFIVHGTKTTVEQSPWNAAVYSKASNYTLICGGTVITPRIVLSAAHCFFDNRNRKPFNATDYEIFVGKYSRDYKTNDGFQKKHKIRKLKLHENFDPQNSGHYGFDVAVIVLEEPIKLSKYALPACVDWTASLGFAPGEGTPGKLSGWGIINETNYKGTPSQYLLTATLPFISYQKCLGKLKPLPNDQFCAGSDSGPGARKGDSGAGLLFHDNREKSYFLRGIVSSGKNDVWDNPISIAAFTDISYHLIWLDKERKAVEREQALANKGSRGSTTVKPFKSASVTTPSESDDSSTNDGICAVNSDPNSVFALFDSYSNAIDLPAGSKAPENSKIEIVCKTGLAMPNGEKSQQSVCVKEEGWVPSLTLCLNSVPTPTQTVDQGCVANGNDCQPDGSLGYCCSGYCHRIFVAGSTAPGKCFPRQTIANEFVSNAQTEEEGVCLLHSDSNSTIKLTDAGNNVMNLTSKAPENSTMEITCKTDYAMPNGQKVLKSSCTKEDGWVPTLTFCLRVVTESVELTCVPNKKNCQPDGSLGNCCSGYCHKEFGWVTGKCRPNIQGAS